MSSWSLAICGAYVAILGGAGLCAYAITWLTSGRRLALSVAAFVLAAGSACALSQTLWQPPKASVSIRRLREAPTAASPLAFIEGTVSPPDATVWLLVHPNGERRWWVQAHPSGAGIWVGQIHLGQYGSGQGQYFQVIALASPRPAWADALHFESFEENQQLDRLPALPRSEIFTIWRPQ